MLVDILFLDFERLIRASTDLPLCTIYGSAATFPSLQRNLGTPQNEDKKEGKFVSRFPSAGLSKLRYERADSRARAYRISSIRYLGSFFVPNWYQVFLGLEEHQTHPVISIFRDAGYKLSGQSVFSSKMTLTVLSIVYE